MEMKTISKKIQHPYFDDVSSGLKKFELRQDEKIYTILMREINKHTGEILVSICERGVEEELKKRIGYLHIRSVYNQDLSFYMTLKKNEKEVIEILKEELVEEEPGLFEII